MSGLGRHAASHAAVRLEKGVDFHTPPCKFGHTPAMRCRGMPPTRSRRRVHLPAFGRASGLDKVFASAALRPVGFLRQSSRSVMQQRLQTSFHGFSSGGVGAFPCAAPPLRTWAVGSDSHHSAQTCRPSGGYSVRLWRCAPAPPLGNPMSARFAVSRSFREAGPPRPFEWFAYEPP